MDTGGSPIMHYILEKREAGCKVWATLTTLPPSVTECELENMAAGKEYFVRIKSVNKYGVSEARELVRPVSVTGAEKGRSTMASPDTTHLLQTPPRMRQRPTPLSQQRVGRYVTSLPPHVPLLMVFLDLQVFTTS